MMMLGRLASPACMMSKQLGVESSKAFLEAVAAAATDVAASVDEASARVSVAQNTTIGPCKIEK